MKLMLSILNVADHAIDLFFAQKKITNIPAPMKHFGKSKPVSFLVCRTQVEAVDQMISVVAHPGDLVLDEDDQSLMFFAFTFDGEFTKVRVSVNCVLEHLLQLYYSSGQRESMT